VSDELVIRVIGEEALSEDDEETTYDQRRLIRRSRKGRRPSTVLGIGATNSNGV
jgi:hypothetical protein